MKFSLQFPIAEFTGKTGPQGLVAFTWRAGLRVFRRFVSPTNPGTSEQASVRNYLAQCAQGYQALTAGQVSGWRTYAASHPILNFGENVTLPPNAMYARVNMYRLIDGQALSAAAPSVEADFLATGIATIAYNSGTTHLTFDVSHNCVTTTGRKWLVRITPSLASGVVTPRKGDYRLAMGINAGSVISVSASPQTVDITGPVISNWANSDWMSIELIPLSSEYSPGTSYAEKGQITVT